MGEGGQKMTKFEGTYFLNDPIVFAQFANTIRLIILGNLYQKLITQFCKVKKPYFGAIFGL